uniref:t-SNARE coiled-coil homology domain-containing protein n=1 Tax=Syphacia muris TaxID=451379 RepID=A0A0N5ADB5_9BILA
MSLQLIGAKVETDPRRPILQMLTTTATTLLLFLLQCTATLTATDLYRRTVSTPGYSSVVRNPSYPAYNQQVSNPVSNQYLYDQRYVGLSINRGFTNLFKGSVATANITRLNANLRHSNQYGKQFDWSILSRQGNRTEILNELQKIVTESFKEETRKEIEYLKNKANSLNGVARELEFQSEELRSRASEQSKIIRRNAEYMRDQVEEQVELLRTQGEMIRIQAEHQSAIIREEAEQIRLMSGPEYRHLLIIANNVEHQGRKQIDIVRKQASQLRINLRDHIEMMNLQGQAQASQMQLLSEQIAEQASIFRVQARNVMQPADQMLRNLEALTDLMRNL